MPKLKPISYRRLVQVFQADGFHFVREEGDHMVFTKPGVLRPIVIPKYASVPVFIIKNNLRTEGCRVSDTSNFSVGEPLGQSNRPRARRTTPPLPSTPPASTLL